MARSVRWTLAALDDLDQAAKYIARDSATYAAAFVRDALSTARSLQQYAERGRIVPEFEQDNIRELFVGSYRLVYRVGDRVEILAIIHGARDTGAVWDRRDPKG